MTRVAINGFGRIGRLTLRAWIESGRDDLDVVAINDLMPVDTMAHLFATTLASCRTSYAAVKMVPLLLPSSALSVW